MFTNFVLPPAPRVALRLNVFSGDVEDDSDAPPRPEDAAERRGGVGGGSGAGGGAGRGRGGGDAASPAALFFVTQTEDLTQSAERRQARATPVAVFSFVRARVWLYYRAESRRNAPLAVGEDSSLNRSEVTVDHVDLLS